MPIFSAIIAAATAVATAAGSFLAPLAGVFGGWAAIGKSLIVAGLNLAINALKPKPTPAPSGVELEMQFGEGGARKARCGLTASAGHMTYPNSYGPANGTLQQVFELSDYPAAGITRIWINGELATWGAADPIKGPVLTNTEFAGLIWYKFHDGWQTEADAGLVANANPVGRWTAAHVGFGIAYVIMTMAFNREKLSGPPQFFFEFEGAALYDWRLDSSVGGSGAQRWADPSTWAPTRNPIVIAYNYKRGISFNDDLFCGMEYSAIDLPLGKWSLAANICDETVNGRPRYVCSVGLDCLAEHGENIDVLMKSCGGLMVAGVDGVWPVVGTAQTTVATLTDFDLVVGQPVRVQLRRSMSELVNSVSGTYPNPDNQWSDTGYEAATDGALLATDRRTRPVAMNFETVPDGEQCAQLASIYLAENRLEGTATIVVRPKWQKLEQGDWIDWNSARYGARVWMVTDMQIMSMDSEGPRNVRLSLQERAGPMYDAVTVPAPVVPLGPAAPVYAAELQDFTAIASIGTGADSRAYPIIRVSWSAPVDPSVSGAVIEWKVAGQDAVVMDRTVTADRTVAILAEGVVSVTDYQVRHKLTTDPARATVWSAWKDVTTLDAPASDVIVDLSKVDADIGATFEGLAAGLADLRSQVADIGQSVQLAGLANYSTVSRVEARADKAHAAITVEQDVRASGDQAIAAQLVSVSAAVGTNAADLSQEILTRADADSAIAADVGTLGATVAGVSADLVAEQSTRADADSANAAAVTALNADYNGRFADGLMKFEAQAAPGGVDARFSVMIRAGTDDDFKAAGFFLDLRTVEAIQRSEFSVLADRFSITDGTNTSFPMVFEDGEAKLNTARIGTVVFDQLSSANGKLVIKGSGSNASIELFS